MAGLKKGCSVYVVFSGKKVKLPVNPEEIKTEYPAEHKTYDVIGVGQVAVPQKPSLKAVSWDGFFPGSRDAPYVNSGAKSPEYYVKYFEKALKKKQKCRLIISRSKLHDTNMRCIVSSFETQDKGGEPHDIYYSLELLEYRPYSPKTVAVITDPDTGEDAAQGAAESPRPVETPVLRVGASVIVNGEYWYSSYGAAPHKTANNLQTTVTRIEPAERAYPIHVGSYGWVQESQLQIVG